MKRTEISNKNLLHSRKKGKGRLIKSIFILLVLIGSLAAVLMFSPLLLLSDIHADEAVNYTADEIIEAAGIEKGENAIKYLGGSFNHLVNLRMGAAESNINKLPWLNSLKLNMCFPTRFT